MAEDDDAYSGFTSDSDEDDFRVASGSKSKGTKALNAGGYIIRNALKTPRATTYTAQAIYDQVVSGDINLEPEYQRDVVWPEAKQIGLIDSILRNFYIPPVIFAVNILEDGSETRTCIDGKQRLTSIQRFMDGLIPHRDPFTHEKLWFKSVPSDKGSKTRKLLPERYRQLFKNKQVVCVEYQDLTDSNERDIFRRVQLGMALTPAEKLQVISSPIANFVRGLQSTYLPPVESSSRLTLSSLDLGTNRGSDFRLMSHSVFLIQKYSEQQGSLKGIKSAGTLAQLEKWLTKKDAVPLSFMDLIEGTLKTFVNILEDPGLKKLSGLDMRVSPIEFVFITLLLSIWRGKMDLRTLSEQIADMRKAVRAEHKDIRMNAKVASTLFDFIKGITLAKNGKRKRDLEDLDTSETKRVSSVPKNLAPTPVSAGPYEASTRPRPGPPSFARRSSFSERSFQATQREGTSTGRPLLSQGLSLEDKGTHSDSGRSALRHAPGQVSVGPNHGSSPRVMANGGVQGQWVHDRYNDWEGDRRRDLDGNPNFEDRRGHDMRSRFR